MIAVSLDEAVHVEDIAGNLVNAMAAVAVALCEIGIPAAMIAPGAITLVRYPAGVV
ncbi:hypothetical protein SDC9_194213 [bioreactor metagenome]|uniref:Uncharacterized protein n=1 Tax=bioreactor metagenome TaxID=1076179 RepID=A0A645I761_9ZZZZ